MRIPRVIPVLLIKGRGLVKTRQFSNPHYLGDPLNIARIFNDKEVDELVVLDISATVERRPPQFDLPEQIVSECFMPVTYGGGLRRLEDIQKIFRVGVEKVAINSYAVENPQFITELARVYGSQSIVISIDARRRRGGYEVRTQSGRQGTGLDVVAFSRQMQDAGAGEILLNSIDRDGTMEGFDLSLIESVSSAVSIPVVACGGAGNIQDLRAAVIDGGASAVAAGSIFVYQGRHRAVLISYPKREELEQLFV